MPNASVPTAGAVTASSGLTLRFVGDVDDSLRREVRAFAGWIRQWYTFPNPLEIRLLAQDVITGDDGQDFEMSWWQSERGRERVVVELAVGSLACGPALGHRGTGCPEALAAVGRGLKCYYQSVGNAPFRSDHVERWSEKLLQAYLEDGTPPPPRSGVKER